MNLGKGKVFSGRVILFLAVCLKVLGATIPKIAPHCKLFCFEVCLIAFFVVFFFSLHAVISLSFLVFLFQALKLTRDVEREPFAKSAVSKWTVILFTAYDLCEPCIIFLMKKTVNRPLTGVKNLLFFPLFFFFFFLFC